MKPDGPLSRAAKLAAMTAGVTGSYLGYLAQSLLLGHDAKDEKLRAAHRRAGKRLTETMGNCAGRP